MQGVSRSSLGVARQGLDEVLRDGLLDRGRLAEELLAVADAVGGSSQLRRALTDPSREGGQRVAVLSRLLEGKVSPEAIRAAGAAVSQRWSRDRDLVAALEALGVEAILASAESGGRLGRVEDELFRFERIVTGSDELRRALTDRRAPAAAKGDLVRRLLGDKVAPETLRLAQHAVSAPRSRRYDQAVERFLALAAQRQSQVTATVTAAVPLDERQLERLRAALGRQYGRPVQANVLVDPQVVGGIRVEIGDEVIDGTILSRLDDARRRLAG